jgi:hypothetical protein
MSAAGTSPNAVSAEYLPPTVGSARKTARNPRSMASDSSVDPGSVTAMKWQRRSRICDGYEVGTGGRRHSLDAVPEVSEERECLERPSRLGGDDEPRRRWVDPFIDGKDGIGVRRIENDQVGVSGSLGKAVRVHIGCEA